MYNFYEMEKEENMNTKTTLSGAGSNASALNKGLTVLLIAAIIIFTVTFSIGLPIYVRPFYYAHIEALDMPYWTDLSYAQIREAYDEVLDYLTLPGGEFGAGVLSYSEEGASHFADCKKLFNLNLWAMLISGVLIISLVLLDKRGKISFYRFGGFPPCFTAGAGTLSLFAVLGGLAAINFDLAFQVFHKVFFPGKDNWLFDPKVDEIINVMPFEFFRNCAILILSSVVVISVTLIIIGAKARRKGN